MLIINDATGWSLTLELSIMLLENTYSTGITYDDRKIFIVHATTIIYAKQIPVISVSIPTDTFLMPISYHTQYRDVLMVLAREN